MNKKSILAIVGSASRNSSNEKLVDWFVAQTPEVFDVTVIRDLKVLPHFDPELSTANPPDQVLEFRFAVEQASAVLICSPEYVFSIPSGLKNALEWCVATTIFTDKPVGIITASAGGAMAHEELQLILRTLTAELTPETCLLIQGVKGKVNQDGQLTDSLTENELTKFAHAFFDLLVENH